VVGDEHSVQFGMSVEHGTQISDPSEFGFGINPVVQSVHIRYAEHSMQLLSKSKQEWHKVSKGLT
jgi:hypothetical protein